MKYFVKIGEHGNLTLLLNKKHPLIDGFIEVELNNEEYKVISQDLSRYILEFRGGKPVLKYVPKSTEEIALEEEEERNELTNSLRHKRMRECFSIVNRGQLWYMQLTETQVKEINAWYQAWLDVTDTLTIPEKPVWVK